MATATAQKPREVHTKINYFDDPGTPLVPMVIGGPEKPKAQPKIAWPVTITDVTGNEDNFKIDRQGFQYVRHKSCLENYDDDELIKRVYYPEIEELVKKTLTETEGLPRPSSVHTTTHIIRRGQPDGESATPGIGPLYGVHVDQSFAAAEGVAQRFLGDRAEELLQKPRYQIINTWRPLRTITRDPLAVSDANSIPDSDIVTVPVIFPTHHTEALEVKPPRDRTEGHRWYYKHHQSPEDVLFFMQVDSISREPDAARFPRRVPHCAFKDPSLQPGEGEPRVSIEVRVLVFYDEVGSELHGKC